MEEQRDNAIRKRKLKVVLNGGFGNFGLSYDGVELLPELLRSGRWLRLWAEASALVAARHLRWRGVLANTFGPWCPPALWRWANKIGGGHAEGSSTIRQFTLAVLSNSISQPAPRHAIRTLLSGRGTTALLCASTACGFKTQATTKGPSRCSACRSSRSYRRQAAARVLFCRCRRTSSFAVAG